jgi:hypothetical protein
LLVMRVLAEQDMISEHMNTKNELFPASHIRVFLSKQKEEQS